MKKEELEGLEVGRNSWEDELWAYLNAGDGLNCPLFKSCQLRREGNRCLSIDVRFTNRMQNFLDNDFISDTSDFNATDIPRCMGSARIFQLVRRLANNIRDNIHTDRLPVPTDLVTKGCFNLPIEIRLVPLKAYHGAVWRLNDSWVIHLNNKDKSARRRFTLYHEIFHILAHCEAKPVFKKCPDKREGIFNELLADHFSACVLTPEHMMKRKWLELNNVKKMAATFDVPESVMYCGLKFMSLI